MAVQFSGRSKPEGGLSGSSRASGRSPKLGGPGVSQRQPGAAPRPRAPAKPASSGNVVLIGGAVAAVLLILVVVMVMSGGKKADPAPAPAPAVAPQKISAAPAAHASAPPTLEQLIAKLPQKDLRQIYKEADENMKAAEKIRDDLAAEAAKAAKAAGVSKEKSGVLGRDSRKEIENAYRVKLFELNQATARKYGVRAADLENVHEWGDRKGWGK